MASGLAEALIALGAGSLLGGGMRTIMPKRDAASQRARSERLAANPVEFQNDIDYSQNLIDPAVLAEAARGGAVIGNGPEGPIRRLPMVEAPPGDYADTQLGDAIAAQRKARVLKATIEGAAVKERIGRPGVDIRSREKAVQQFIQKYPDVPLSMKPATTEQAMTMRNNAMLEQFRDQAQSMGFPAEAISHIDKNGQPVVSNLFLLQQKMQEQQQNNEVETQRIKIAEAAATEREEKARAHDRYINADKAWETAKTLAGPAPRKPDLTDPLTTPQMVKDWEKESNARKNLLDEAKKQYMLDRGYKPTQAEPSQQWTPPHATIPAMVSGGSAVQSAGAAAQSTMMDDIQRAWAPGTTGSVEPAQPIAPDVNLGLLREKAREANLPIVLDPINDPQDLQSGDKFMGSNGKVYKYKTPAERAAEQATRKQNEVKNSPVFKEAQRIINGEATVGRVASRNTAEEMAQIAALVQETVAQAPAQTDNFEFQAMKPADFNTLSPEVLTALSKYSDAQLARKPK